MLRTFTTYFSSSDAVLLQSIQLCKKVEKYIIYEPEAFYWIMYRDTVEDHKSK
jgi:hypothetical protein